MMAITRKQKESSAGTDKSDNDHQEDCGPSKKTAAENFNIKSPECIPLPRCGTVPVVTMIIRLGERDEVARIQMDTGSTVPLFSRSYVKNRRITVAERPTLRPIQDYTGKEVQGAGKFDTAPLVL